MITQALLLNRCHGRQSGQAALIVCLVLAAFANAMQAQSLSLQAPRSSQDLVGTLVNHEDGTLYWFVLEGDQPTVFKHLAAGRYAARLICTMHVEINRREITLSRGDKATTTFPHLSGYKAVRVVSNVLEVGPGTSARMQMHSCELQDLLQPVLLSISSRTATAVEVNNAVATRSGDSGKPPSLIPLKTPVEFLMAELILLQREEDQIRVAKERSLSFEKTKLLLATQRDLWSKNRGKLVGERLVEDKGVLLGMLAAVIQPAQVEEGQSAMLTVQYFSSHEIVPTDSGSAYELEITQEPPISENVFHVQVFPQHARASQQVAPVVSQGVWKFLVKSLPGFKGSPVELRYLLRKVSRGTPAREMASGQLVQNTRLDLKQSPPVHNPTWWEKLKPWVQDFGTLVGWLLATFWAILRIIDWARKRRKSAHKARAAGAYE